MKLTEMTKEELIAARSVHEKTGATLKVAKINELLGDRLIHRWEGDALPDNFTKVIPDESAEFLAKNTVVVDNNALMVKEAYELKSNTTMSWKEIGDRVGLKAQGLYAKVRKYARENELPYE